MNWITQTEHSYISIRKNAFFLDWNSQPKKIKEYPHFYPKFEIDELDLIGKSTFEHRGYQLRTVPSAGGLYPCEVYIQIRGVKPFIDGIYHYENSKFALLYELIDDGVEYYIDKTKRFNGFLFIVSAVYFRSSWKYKDRAIRYIFLDSGHQIGTIYAMLQTMNMNSEIIFDFDKLALNNTFGFDKYELSTAIIRSGYEVEKETKELRLKLPFVAGCDYLEENNFIFENYKTGLKSDIDIIKNINFFQSKENLKDSILKRRSIRAFYKNPITKDEFLNIIDGIFEFANSYNINIYYTIHNIIEYQQGLYKNFDLLKDGNFANISGYLSLEQKLGSDSCLTIYFTSNNISQESFIFSGFIAHIIYLRATSLNIGCSGIGAYYDQEVRDFLNTTDNILYMLSVGR
jgi:SagB-type dehydrogenase family enzyme